MKDKEKVIGDIAKELQELKKLEVDEAIKDNWKTLSGPFGTICC
ncbi:MAG: hypothetical protein Q4D16_24200 [Eubacteriales bacterium]|nr:hypothetical protein [Eubacteriales bacterium]